MQPGESRTGAALIVSALICSALVWSGLAWSGPSAVAADRSNRVIETTAIGRSVEDREIWAYRKGNPDATRKVVVLGQMDGDEPAGVRTARYIKNHVPVSLSADVWTISTMNPDGLDAGSRQTPTGSTSTATSPPAGPVARTADAGPRAHRRPGR